jgi:hypothetical protein
MQDVYAASKRKWGLYVDAGFEQRVLSSEADVRLNLRYRAATIFAGYGLAEYAGEPRHGVVYGGRIKLIGWR